MKRFFVLAAAFLLLAAPVSGQVEATLRGVVRSAASGKPIESAMVQIIGTNVATQTDEDGRYSLMSVPVGVSVIRITHDDHVTISERVEVAQVQLFLLDFEMMGPEYVLEEVVAKAMRGPVEIPDNVAEAREVRGDRGISQVLNEVSGVTLVRTGGAIGMGYYLRIRGSSSINFDKLPLIIVDGVRMDGFDGGAHVLELLSSETLGNVEVAKGPSAHARYGPEAADGVIVITTKRGGSWR